MKIIISPAKQMRVDEDAAGYRQPLFLKRSRDLLKALRDLDYPALKQLWQCNDKLAQQNYERLQQMDLTRNLTPAVLAYDGLQYTHMGPRVFDEASWQYVCENLRILSGFYGILRADDGIVPYRLEMQAKLACCGFKNLYAFWGNSICKQITTEDKVILNLASKEYSKVIEPYLESDVLFVSCVFASGNQEKYKVKATEAKMARGFMVRWCAERQITDIQRVKEFNGYGYRFCEELSDDREYVFLKGEKQSI